MEASDAPYFVDLVRDTLISKLERARNERPVVPHLHHHRSRPAESGCGDAVETGMKLVDEQVTKRRTKTNQDRQEQVRDQGEPGPHAAGGAGCDESAHRRNSGSGGRPKLRVQPVEPRHGQAPHGSIFKPFVYAAAMNTALDGTNPVFTPASMVDDQPSTFAYGDQIYEPRNYKEEYHGQVTARYALAMSLNNATVKLAEEVGYEKVAESGESRRHQHR